MPLGAPHTVFGNPAFGTITPAARSARFSTRAEAEFLRRASSPSPGGFADLAQRAMLNLCISDALPPQHNSRVAPRDLRGVLCVPGHQHNQRARGEVLPPRRARLLLPEEREHCRFFLDRRGRLRPGLPVTGRPHGACIAACSARFGRVTSQGAKRNTAPPAHASRRIFLLLRVPLSTPSSCPALKAISAFFRAKGGVS